MTFLGRCVCLFLVSALAFAACSSGQSSGANNPDEELAISLESAPLTRDQFINLATVLAVGENFDGEQIMVNDDLLRTLATLHIRSTALVDFIAVEDVDNTTLPFLQEQAEQGISNLLEAGEIMELDDDSVEFSALLNIILADRGSNPLRAEIDPATGQPVVGDNPFTSSFVFDPNLRANFDTVSPGFLQQFDETFAEFTEGVTLDADLGLWNAETFTVDAP